MSLGRRAGPPHCRVQAFLIVLGLLFAPMPAQAEAEATGLLIRDVRVIDASGEAPGIAEHQSVLIRDGEIVSVTDDAALDPGNPGEGVRIVEGRNRTLVPGLADMHVHIWDEAELGAYLASGVTTVRNMSGMPFLLDMRDRIAARDLAGPRIVTTGPILNSPGANAQLNHQIVETAEDARAAVRQQHEQGYRRIKVYSNLNREAYEAIRNEAALLGMTVSGHTPEGARTTDASGRHAFEIDFAEILDDEFETIEHVESIVWHGLRDGRDAEEGRALARRIAAAGATVDPTLIAFANLARIAETQGAHLDRPGTDTLNPFIRSMETAQSERWSNEDVPRAQAQLAFYTLFTRMLAEEGVPLVAGSDAGIATNIPGVSLHDELDLLMAAGFTPYQALQAATRNAARLLDGPEMAGRIAPGARADLLLVDGDPLTDIATLRRPAALVAGGRLYTAEDLARLGAAAAETDAERTAANVLGAMVAQGTEVDLGE